MRLNIEKINMLADIYIALMTTATFLYFYCVLRVTKSKYKFISSVIMAILCGGIIWGKVAIIKWLFT
ncbi:MAG: hypothetical protein ACRC92_23985 [Peptostreptococcaceae bacterium]